MSNYCTNILNYILNTASTAATRYRLQQRLQPLGRLNLSLCRKTKHIIVAFIQRMGGIKRDVRMWIGKKLKIKDK